MGDRRRFDLFARLIEQHLDPALSIADVASGRGSLQAALRQRGFTRVVSWDRRNRNAKNRLGYRWGYFTADRKEKYDAVVAMHPDEGTDHAVVYATLHRVPALICPCCIRPSAVTYWGGSPPFTKWIEHLRKLAEQGGLRVEEYSLRMSGKNLVLIIKP